MRGNRPLAFGGVLGSCLVGFCLVLGLLVFSSPSSCCVSFPFNDDLGTPPTRRPHSWKKITRLPSQTLANYYYYGYPLCREEDRPYHQYGYITYTDDQWDRLCAWLSGDPTFRRKIERRKKELKEKMGGRRDDSDNRTKARRIAPPPGGSSSSSAARPYYRSRPPPPPPPHWWWQ